MKNKCRKHDYIQYFLKVQLTANKIVVKGAINKPEAKRFKVFNYVTGEMIQFYTGSSLFKIILSINKAYSEAKIVCCCYTLNTCVFSRSHVEL